MNEAGQKMGSRRRRWKWALCAAASILLLGLFGVPASVEVGSWFVSLPPPLEPGTSAASPGLRVLDRGNILLAEVRHDGKLSLPLEEQELPRHVVDTLLAAEDKRFFEHAGVDWLAVGRALFQWAWSGHIVSGASTLTQQLARSTFTRERSLWGKWQEMLVARRIERSLSKQQILKAYLDRIEFGPNLVGLGAASYAYFAKPVSGLSLSEAATLTGIPRGPSLYDPKRRSSPIKRRRDRILERLAENEPRYAEPVKMALSMPLELQESWVAPGAFHWVRRQVNESTDVSEVRTTLDSGLQRRVEALVSRHAETMQRFGATAAAVLVADNHTRDVLAYVGSPDYAATKTGGQNDGVRARRQPGSTLKPFVYAAAMRELGYTAATLLPDVPLEFRESGKVYSPRNYDGHFKGPVRLREALANSLNVPAVYTASQLGVGRVLTELHRFGFRSLDRDPEFYGVALALGDGEVTLDELVAAYMTLANDGLYAPLRTRLGQGQPESSAVVSAPIAKLVKHILEDPLARAAAFGRHGVLEFEFPVAVKTGTSKGARDNWTIGFSSEVTVGVWVGNFDGTPMTGASGVSGAGPLFHAIMNEATARVAAGSPAASNGAAGPSLIKARICALSGKLPTDICPTTLNEWFIPGSEPTGFDDMHVALPVWNGAIAPHCPERELRTFERYPPPFERWAIEAGRPVAPTRVLVDCKDDGHVPASKPEVTFPRQGAEYRWVADEPEARQQLVLRARAKGGALTFVVDRVPYRTVHSPYEAEWLMTPGEHTVQVVSESGEQSEVVRFRVR